MPNLNKIIITAADYKVLLIIPTLTGSKTFPVATAETVEWTDARENEDIYAIGEEDPIGNKSNGNNYKGKFTIQNGEMNVILQICGFVTGIQITGATLAISALVGGFSKVYSGMNINTQNVSIKAKDKQSMADCDWSALSVN